MNKACFIRNKGGLNSLLNGMQSFLDQKKQYTSPLNKGNTSNQNKINKTIKIKSEIRQMYQQLTGNPRGNEVLTNNNFFTNQNYTINNPQKTYTNRALSTTKNVPLSKTKPFKQRNNSIYNSLKKENETKTLQKQEDREYQEQFNGIINDKSKRSRNSNHLIYFDKQNKSVWIPFKTESKIEQNLSLTLELRGIGSNNKDKSLLIKTDKLDKNKCIPTKITNTILPYSYK